MSRTQTFDTAEAVRAARAVFWEQGFEGAALPELERATGWADRASTTRSVPNAGCSERLSTAVSTR